MIYLSIGDDDTSVGQMFGVHTVVMHNGIYRIENVEVRKCGQAFNLGRYCTHGHHAMNMEGRTDRLILSERYN
jgi:hypothetical protein